MKNIHLLLTGKPSRLYLDSKNNLCITDIEMKCGNTHNIYITSTDSWVRNNEYYYDSFDKTVKKYVSKFYQAPHINKIILTTGVDLIKDGVQEIPDEFLEWFVKNPSCEEVEVNKLCYGALSGFADAGYKIIIPKEEFSKDEIDKFFVDMVCNPKEEPKPFKQMEKLTEVDWEKFKKSPFPSKKVPKQETLEEFAENYLNKFYNNYVFKDLLKPLLIDGAKWQAEKMYSEGDMWEAYKASNTIFEDEIALRQEFDEWFEQFKNK